VEVGRVEGLLGLDLDADRIRELLVPLGFAVDGSGSAVDVTVPAYRQDVTVPADVAEEIARAHGYERIPGRLPFAALPPYRSDPSEPRHVLRRVLAGFGVDEIVAHALIGAEDLTRSGYPATGDHLVRLYNPLSEEHAILRPALAPSLLSGVSENARRRRPDAWLFDLGKVYWRHDGAPTPREKRAETAGTGRYESWELGIVLAGAPVAAAPGEPARSADVATLKGMVDALHDAIGAPRPSYRAEDDAERHPHRHPGRSGLICDASGRPYGSLGEVHPRIVSAWGLTGRPVDAAIDVDRLLDLVPARGGVRTPSTAQPVDRDLAVVVEEATPVGEVLRVARMSAGELLDELRLFDVYRGEQIGADRVSYAIAFRFQPGDVGDEKAIDKAMNKVRGSLKHHLNAEIR
jgi:phenylalanyl-tRNA synthetase beta chain